MTSTDDDSIGDGLGGSYSIDEGNQLQPEDTLVDLGVDDVLDVGYSPPERPLGVDKFGTTASEAEQGESLDLRLTMEQPDPNLQVEDPLHPDRFGQRTDDDDRSDRGPGDDGVDDDADDDAEIGDERAGRLMAPDEGTHEDTEKDLVAQDVGISGAAAGAEEAAVHVIDEHDLP